MNFSNNNLSKEKFQELNNKSDIILSECGVDPKNIGGKYEHKAIDKLERDYYYWGTLNEYDAAAIKLVELSPQSFTPDEFGYSERIRKCAVILLKKYGNNMKPSFENACYSIANN